MKKKEINVSDIQDIQMVEPKRKALHTIDKSPKKEGKLKTLFKSKTFQIGVVVFLVGIGAIVAVFYSVFAYNPTQTASLLSYNPESLLVVKLPSSPYNPVTLAEPSEPRTKINPINGVLLTQSEFDEYSDRVPVAAMVNNHLAARPQSNLQQADIVYEAIVESGITRYMPIYWENAPEKIGPIRSLRQYYLEWVGEYDAIIIHDGFASSDDPRVDARGNIWRYGARSISTQGAWRDNTRFAPHNEYSSILNAYEIGENNEWTGLPSGFKSWEFKNDAPIDERGDISSIAVSNHLRLTNNGLYDSIWEYDKDTNVYLRSIGGLPDVDLETGKQLETKTVILQHVAFYPTGDEKAHNILETIGEGEATIFMDGEIMEATWKKPTRTERTMFFGKDGKGVEFNRGLIWVTALSTTDGQFDIIEQ